MVIKEALILAGGKGTRLDPLGNYLPKCLATVYNRPLIDCQLELLEKANFEKVHIAVSARHAGVVQASIGCLPRKTMAIELVEEATPQGIHALFHAARYICQKPFVLILGDIYCQADLPILPELGKGTSACLVTRQFSSAEVLCRTSAQIEVSNGFVKSITDKPRLNDIQNTTGWAGIAGVGQALFDLEGAIFASLAHKQQTAIGDLFAAALYSGTTISAVEMAPDRWLNINHPNDLLRATIYEARKQKSQKLEQR